MNKFIIAFLLVISSNILLGQTEKGKFLIGAGSNLGLNHSAGYYNISANLKGGYFLFKNVAIGLEPSWNYYRGDINNYLNTRNIYTLLPFARYYIRANKFGFFAEAKGGPGVSTYMSNDKNKNIKVSRSNTDWYLAGGLGVDYFVNDNVAIELNNTLLSANGNNNPSFISNFGFLILF